MMQHSGNLLRGVSDQGLLKLDKINEAEVARRRWLSMASRPVVEANPNQVRWICLKVMPGREKAVEMSLEALDIEALVPMRKGKEHHRRGRVIPAADIPVLIGYVLIRCVPSDTAMAGLKTVDHVAGVLGGWLTPMPIEQDFISRYKDKAAAGVYDYDRPSVAVRKGQVVDIIDGPFVGHSGCVVSCRDGDVGDVVVEVDCFGRMTPVLVPLAMLGEL